MLQNLDLKYGHHLEWYQELPFAIAMLTGADLDGHEALEYPVGLKVELKSRPGVVDEIASYDEMMVPPIWLANDPQPRYPHELRKVEPIWSIAVNVALQNARQTLRRCLT